MLNVFCLVLVFDIEGPIIIQLKIIFELFNDLNNILSFLKGFDKLLNNIWIEVLDNNSYP